ncbi:zinc finger protein 600-like [Bolinopsis microptera]|uniref:zinc finger protein 600-like n=1 Tax=Bolinopsis microptera TaxID=2820187 RepID=UPI0030797D61
MRLRSTMKLRSSRSSWNYIASGPNKTRRISYDSPQRYLLDQFVPVQLVRSVQDMTCTINNTESDTAPPSSCAYYSCDNCPQAFCCEEEFAQHTRTHHTQAPPPAEDNNRSSRNTTLTCRTCSYTAPDANKATVHDNLHRDQKSGDKVYKCKTCNFLSCSKMGVTIHKRLEHAPLKYECPMCNYSSFNARHVTAHVDKVHCNPAKSPGVVSTAPLSLKQV